MGSGVTVLAVVGGRVGANVMDVRGMGLAVVEGRDMTSAPSPATRRRVW